ncbi:MAG: glycosyltransferase family 39 protein [Acidobacteriota bacterium]
MNGGKRRADLAVTVAAAVLIAGSYVSFQHLSVKSAPTWDEMHMWGMGYYLLKTGRFDLPGLGWHPPLTSYLNSLPLLSRDIPIEAFRTSHSDRFYLDVDRGNQIFPILGLDVFRRSRTPFVLIACLTGAAVFAWSRSLWGPAGGLLSLCLYLLCPTLMANEFLMTTDGLMSLLLFVALAALIRSLESPTTASLAFFVIATALAPGAKITGLLIGPLAALAVAVRLVLPGPFSILVPRRGLRAVGRIGFLAYWAIAGAIAVAAIWLSLAILYQGDVALRTFRFAATRVSGYVAEHGSPVFLDGHVSSRGFREYYGKALLYKTPIATLAAWLLAMLVPAGVPRWRALAMWIPSAIVLVYFSFSGYTISLRFALVSLLWLHAAAGRLAAPGRFAGARRVAAGLLVAATLGDVAGSYPYPRAFVDRAFVRGPGYTAIADADLDWGEGLLAVRDYAAAHKLGPIALSYHGSIDPEALGIQLAWYENPLDRKRSHGTPPDHGLIFVSGTNLAGLYYPGGKRHEFEDRYCWLKTEKPVEVVGGAIYVFDLDAVPAERRWRPWVCRHQ